MYIMHDGANHQVHLDVMRDINPKTCAEIGTYYGGITYKMAKERPDCHFFAIQSYHDHKLNHMPDTDRGEYSIGQASADASIGLDAHLEKQDWKRAVVRHFPEEYHNYFDFNLLVKTFQDLDNVSIILDTSPFKWQFPFVDLAIFDVSPLLDENIRQFDYWAPIAETILMGAYNHQEEFYKYVTDKGYYAENIREDYVLCMT